MPDQNESLTETSTHRYLDKKPDAHVDVAIPKDMDQAAAYLVQNAAEYPPMSAEMEKRIVRKLDWILTPMVCIS